MQTAPSISDNGISEAIPSERRVIIPVENKDGLESRVCSRFGHAPYFAVLDVDTQGQLQGGIVDNPCGAEHRPGVVPRFIRSLDADVVLAQSVGKTAFRALQKNVTFQRAAGRTVLESALLWFEGKSLPLDPKAEHEGSASCGADQIGPSHSCHAQSAQKKAGSCCGHGHGGAHEHGEGHGCRHQGKGHEHGEGHQCRCRSHSA